MCIYVYTCISIYIYIYICIYIYTYIYICNTCLLMRKCCSKPLRVHIYGSPANTVNGFCLVCICVCVCMNVHVRNFFALLRISVQGESD